MNFAHPAAAFLADMRARELTSRVETLARWSRRELLGWRRYSRRRAEV
jgi:hypothetical protein